MQTAAWRAGGAIDHLPVSEASLSATFWRAKLCIAYRSDDRGDVSDYINTQFFYKKSFIRNFAKVHFEIEKFSLQISDIFKLRN